jgi:hypothetical protein
MAAIKAAGAAHLDGAGARDFEHAGEPLEILATKTPCQLQSASRRRMTGPKFNVAGRRPKWIPVFRIIRGGVE